MDFLQRVAKSELGDSLWFAFEAADYHPEWRWRHMPSYNGFTHEERVRGWQFSHWMMRNGRMQKPQRCSISGATEELQYHCEDYYRPWLAHAIAKPLHFALHRRFRQPSDWLAALARHACTGEEWFARLAMVPADLAEEIRVREDNQ